MIENKDKILLLEKSNLKISLYHNIVPTILGYENGRIIQATITLKENKEEVLEFDNENVISKNKEATKIFNEIVNYFN